MSAPRSRSSKNVLVVILGLLAAAVAVLITGVGQPAADSLGPGHPPLQPSPTAVMLRDDYFMPTGWTVKQFNNWNYRPTPQIWEQCDGTSLVFNRGSDYTVCGQRVLVRWDMLHNNSDHNCFMWWGGDRQENVAYYFREGYSSDAGTDVIWAVGHYPVDWISGFPDPCSNPPFNADRPSGTATPTPTPCPCCPTPTPTPTPATPGPCEADLPYSWLHKRGDVQDGGCVGWGPCGGEPTPIAAQIPYVYMPVQADLSTPWSLVCDWANPGNECDPGGGAFYLAPGQGGAHAGTYAAWLGGYDNASDVLTLTATVPDDLVSAHLSFWRLISTAEISGSHDRLHVELRDGSGRLIAEVLFLDNQSPDLGGWRPEVRDLSAYLVPHRGQPVEVRFQAETDGNGRVTDFFLDDVRLTFCAPGGLLPPPPTPEGGYPPPPEATPLPPPTPEGGYPPPPTPGPTPTPTPVPPPPTKPPIQGPLGLNFPLGSRASRRPPGRPAAAYAPDGRLYEVT